METSNYHVHVLKISMFIIGFSFSLRVKSVINMENLNFPSSSTENNIWYALSCVTRDSNKMCRHTAITDL